MSHNLFDSRTTFTLAHGKTGMLYSLQALETAGLGKISRLPVSIRIVLESVLRNYDGRRINEDHVRQLAGWQPNAKRTEEIPFLVARIVLQDFTGVPLLADLAAMRDAAAKMGCDPGIIEPLVPVHLVVDHSVQVDYYNRPDALKLNMGIEFERNNERYKFIKWGMQAFNTFKAVPPGVGIVHQVNLEHLARGVLSKDSAEGSVYYPDTLVGTDSHTTMINGLGVVGWGVGGIEAEAGMLGQPVYFLTPDVVGVHLTGKLREGVTATDLVLAITEMLRNQKVVGKFVEFFGAGAAALTLPDRATIANMAPEYGATMGFFPVDDVTIDYLRSTGRRDDEIDACRAYYKAQGLYGIPLAGDIDYSKVVELNLNSVQPSLAGPKRPQDRVILSNMQTTFNTLFSKPITENGFNQAQEKLSQRYTVTLTRHDKNILGGGLQNGDSAPAGKPALGGRSSSAASEIEMMDLHPTAVAHDANDPLQKSEIQIGHGDVLIAAVTSCTNTSNPSVMLAAGLLAKKAVEAGLRVHPHIKTSLAPGSRVVTDYLNQSGLMPYLEALGFRLVGYGCTTCIGNSGPLDVEIEGVIIKNEIIAAAVLSGNRNFEARIHANIKANFLASPPLVVAFALAGKVNIDLESEPLGVGKNDRLIYLKDIWPNNEEIAGLMKFAANPQVYRSLYSNLTKDLPLWNGITAPVGNQYQWDDSTYIAPPPLFNGFHMMPGKVKAIKNAKPLGIFGDSVTTDHISPAGSFKAGSPAGQYLLSKGVDAKDFNSYGARRGNHEVMIRGTFANVRIKNLMLPPDAAGKRTEGGYTLYNGKQMSIYDAAMKHMADDTDTIIFAGEEYGTGSSRDWAAKGTQLLGVKAVVARSYERIHRSNLVMMGVMPLQFKGSDSVSSLQLKGDEIFDIGGIDDDLKPQQDVTLTIKRADGITQKVTLLARIDTPIEVDYYRHGGILPYVLRELIAQ